MEKTEGEFGVAVQGVPHRKPKTLFFYAGSNPKPHLISCNRCCKRANGNPDQEEQLMLILDPMLLFGLSTVIGSVAALIWAIRRDPTNTGK